MEGRLQLVLMQHPPAICQNLGGGWGSSGGGSSRGEGGGVFLPGFGSSQGWGGVRVMVRVTELVELVLVL